MNLKSAFMACLSTVAISGTVLAAADPGSTCPFQEMQGNSAFNLTPPQSSSTLDGKSLDVSKLTLLGAGLTALAGLFAGSLLLKQRRDREVEQALTEASDRMPSELSGLSGASEFAIVVPPEALRPPIAEATEEEAAKPELLSIR